MSEDMIILSLLQRFKQLEPEDISGNLSVYQYDGDNRTPLNSFDEFLKSLESLPTRIAFVYKSPIGYYVSIIQYVGGAAISKKNQKAIEESLELTSMNIEELLSNIGRVVVVSNAIFSINKSKNRMINVYNRNVKFSSNIGIVDIQNNAKPFSDLLARYTSPEIISQIPHQAKQKTKTKFKNWSVFPVEQDIVNRKFFIVMITRAEAKKYPTTMAKMAKLNAIAKKNKTLKSVASALIQIVILRPKRQRGHAISGKYEQLYWLLFTLFRQGKDIYVSETTSMAVSQDEKSSLTEAAWQTLQKIDKDIP